MSKELEALEELFGIAIYCNENVEGMNEKEMKEYDKKCENMKKIIEKALIQKDKQEKEIFALNRLCENQEKLIERRESELSEYREVIEGNFEINITEEATPDKLNECISDLIESNDKQQKILDILKKKEVDIDWLKVCNSIYNYNFGFTYEHQLTQEEYDLLKEWLKDD